MSYLDSKRKKETLTLVVVFVLVLGASALAVYLLATRTAQNEPARQSTPSTVSETTPERRPPSPNASDETFLGRVFGVPQSEAHVVRGETWSEVVLVITLRLLVA